VLQKQFIARIHVFWAITRALWTQPAAVPGRLSRSHRAAPGRLTAERNAALAMNGPFQAHPIALADEIEAGAGATDGAGFVTLFAARSTCPAASS
jgi:hypothetical protein